LDALGYLGWAQDIYTFGIAFRGAHSEDLGPLFRAAMAPG